MANKKQADAVAEAQLMAFFGETIESTEEWIAELEAEEKNKKPEEDKKKPAE